MLLQDKALLEPYGFEPEVDDTGDVKGIVAVVNMEA